MDVVLHLPDVYVRRWWELADRVTNGDLYSLMIQSLGIGIQTIDAATQVKGVVPRSNEDNVIHFKPKYYWDDDIIKNQSQRKE